MGRYGSADGEHHHADRKEGTSPGLMAQPGARDDEADSHQRQQGGADTGTRPGNRRERRIRRGAGHPGDGESREGGQPAHAIRPRSSRRPRSARWRPRARWRARRTGPRPGSRPLRPRDTELCSSTITGAHISLGGHRDGEGRAPTADRRREQPARRRRPTARRRGAAPRSPGSTVRSPRNGPATGPRPAGRGRRPRGRVGPAGAASVLRPSSPTAPIAAARTTLGSGRTRTTNREQRARPRVAGASDVARPAAPASPSAAASTIATLLPLTADRCVIPVTSMASSRSWGVREVSPMTSPGSSPRASVGSPSVASANRSRTTSAARATQSGLRQERRRSARNQDRDHVVGVVLRRREAADGLDPRLPGQVEPGPVGEHEHRRGHRGADASTVHLLDVQPQHHTRRALRTATRWIDGTRVGRDDAQHRDRRALVGQVADRSGVPNTGRRSQRGQSQRRGERGQRHRPEPGGGNTRVAGAASDNGAPPGDGEAARDEEPLHRRRQPRGPPERRGAARLLTRRRGQAPGDAGRRPRGSAAPSRPRRAGGSGTRLDARSARLAVERSAPLGRLRIRP